MFKDIIDLTTLLDPDLELDEEQREETYCQIKMGIEVLAWFDIDTMDISKTLKVGNLQFYISLQKIRFNLFGSVTTQKYTEFANTEAVSC